MLTMASNSDMHHLYPPATRCHLWRGAHQRHVALKMTLNYARDDDSSHRRQNLAAAKRVKQEKHSMATWRRNQYGSA